MTKTDGQVLFNKHYNKH